MNQRKGHEEGNASEIANVNSSGSLGLVPGEDHDGSQGEGEDSAATDGTAAGQGSADSVAQLGPRPIPVLIVKSKAKQPKKKGRR